MVTLFTSSVPNSLTFTDPQRLTVNIVLAPMHVRMFDSDNVIIDEHNVVADLCPFLAALRIGDIQATGACIFNDDGYHPLIPTVEKLLTKEFCRNILKYGESRKSIWSLAQVNNILETGSFDQEVEVSTNWPLMSVKDMAKAYKDMRDRLEAARDFPEPITEAYARDIEVRIRKEYGGQSASLYSSREAG